MNTGVQRSARRRPRRAPRRRRPSGAQPGNVFGQGKSVPLIAMAHEIPYVATATVADLHDLEAKVEHAMALRGARYLHVLVPCPLGWGSARHDTIRIARLATRDRALPGLRGRARRGHRASRRSADSVPVEDYLRPQRRFAHLFGPEGAADDDRPHPGRRRPQHRPLRLLDDEARHDDGQAVRDHARRRLEPRQQDRLLAHRAAGLRRPPAAVQRACPAGENIQGWLYHAESGDYEAAWRHDHGRQPASRRSWAASATTRARPPATAASSTRPSASTPSSASSATRRSSRAGRFDAPRDRDRQARARRRRRALGPLGRLPPAPPRPRGDDREAGPAAGRDDALRHPASTACRATCSTPRSQRILDLGVDAEARRQGRRPRADDGGRRLRRRLPRRRRAHRQARVHPGRDAARILDAVALLRSMEGEERAAARPPRRRLRRRQHRDRRRAHRQAPRRERGDHRLPAHARADAGARLRGRGGARGRRAGQVALDHQARRRAAR